MCPGEEITLLIERSGEVQKIKERVSQKDICSARTEPAIRLR